MDMTTPPILSIYPETIAGAKPSALTPLEHSAASFPVQSALPLLVTTKLFTLLASAIKDLTGRVQTEPPKPDVAKQWLPPEGTPTKNSEPPRPAEIKAPPHLEQAANRNAPQNRTDGRVQPQAAAHTKDACQKIAAEERRGKETSSTSAPLPTPVSQDKGELPFAFVVPYMSFKFEDRFTRVKRKRDPREEILEELEEREREEEEKKLLEE